MIRNRNTTHSLHFGFLVVLMLCISSKAFAQPVDTLKVDYVTPAEYTIGGIRVEGTHFYDAGIVVSLTGLFVGDKIDIPGERMSDAIYTIWRQGLFEDVSVEVDSIIKNKIFIVVKVKELPKLAGFDFKGVSKKDIPKLSDKLKQYLGHAVDSQLYVSATHLIKEYYRDKAYYNVRVSLIPNADKEPNYIRLAATAEAGNKFKINAINFIGNIAITDKQLRRRMKETKERKWYNIFKASKYDEASFTKDKEAVIDYYQEKGMRDAAIVKDTVYAFNNKLLNIDITIAEGRTYYIRNIAWVGNTIYTTDTLKKVFGLKRGDVYNRAAIDKALYMGYAGTDISALYMDNGYLFFSVTPVEVLVENDSVDIEMRIYEGRPAYIDKIVITGNTRTSDHVILRELYMKPGQLFRRIDLIQSQQALIRLNYFVPESLNVIPRPNPATGKVDIEIVVVEKPSDQFTLSGGIAAGQIVGTVGVTFTNFSFKKALDRKEWKPIPAGDGQIISINAQSNGRRFQAYNLSVTEPWLGGKKPNSLTGSVFYNAQQQGDQYLKTFGASLGLGMRWRKPDPFLNAYYSLNYYGYNAHDWPPLTEGLSHNINIGATISRNSVEAGDYPMGGSLFSASVQATPPWSIGKDYTGKDKPKLVEYHKWKLDATWYQNLGGKFVLKASARFGYLGYYNKTIGASPFERFSVGGVQIASSNFIGIDYINLRGYENGSLSPTAGSCMFNKFSLELRHPILQKAGSGLTIYGLLFAEGGNAWDDVRTVNPFNLKRSAGAGVRFILPMFGLVGFDAGYGFDTKSITGYSGNPWQFHFIIGKDIN